MFANDNEHYQLVRNLAEHDIPYGTTMLEQYLNYLDMNPSKIEIRAVEDLLGNSLAYKNIIAVSLINNFIRENNIKTTKQGILNSIYFSKPVSDNRMLLIMLGIKVDMTGYDPYYYYLMRD
jgi:hypothetical protein